MRHYWDLSSFRLHKHFPCHLLALFSLVICFFWLIFTFQQATVQWLKIERWDARWSQSIYRKASHLGRRILNIFFKLSTSEITQNASGHREWDTVKWTMVTKYYYFVKGYARTKTGQCQLTTCRSSCCASPKGDSFLYLINPTDVHLLMEQCMKLEHTGPGLMLATCTSVNNNMFRLDFWMCAA